MKRASSPRTYATVAVVLLGCSMLGADCDGDIVSDPTFRDWCGDSLCSWTTDSGMVAQAPTWSDSDLGVSFVAQGTEISQVTTESSASCILFTTVANIDRDAQMTIGVDWNNDGTIDKSWPIDAAYWQQDTVLITAPPSYEGITFHITKAGTGTAILAEMRIQSSTGCSDPSVELSNLKLGEVCLSNEGCAKGLSCESTGGFGTECSQCVTDAQCGGSGARCTQRGPSFPFQCDPGQGRGASGDPCLANDDCQSGACTGASAFVLGDGGADVDGGPCSLEAGSSDASTNCAGYSLVGGACQ
jgi:hypothetical protein